MLVLDDVILLGVSYRRDAFIVQVNVEAPCINNIHEPGHDVNVHDVPIAFEREPGPVTVIRPNLVIVGDLATP